jgi:hypothetical protein
LRAQGEKLYEEEGDKDNALKILQEAKKFLQEGSTKIRVT